jgi:hypothetical protein
LNKLEIILGEEYKVKVEKLEKFNESLFRDLYIQAFKKTKEILEKGEAFPKAPVAVEEEVTKDKKDGKKKRTAQAYSITEDPTRGFNYAKAAIS